MDVREKLLELIDDALQRKEGTARVVGKRYVNTIANHLIENGVTVQEWIPVTERLPEESGMYIITANDGHAQRVSFVQWQKKNRIWNLTGARSYWRVTHWMPMPQPPEGE